MQLFCLSYKIGIKCSKNLYQVIIGNIVANAPVLRNRSQETFLSIGMQSDVPALLVTLHYLFQVHSYLVEFYQLWYFKRVTQKFKCQRIQYTDDGQQPQIILLDFIKSTFYVYDFQISYLCKELLYFKLHYKARVSLPLFFIKFNNFSIIICLHKHMMISLSKYFFLFLIVSTIKSTKYVSMSQQTIRTPTFCSESQTRDFLSHILLFFFPFFSVGFSLKKYIC